MVPYSKGEEPLHTFAGACKLGVGSFKGLSARNHDLDLKLDCHRPGKSRGPTTYCGASPKVSAWSIYQPKDSTNPDVRTPYIPGYSY